MNIVFFENGKKINLIQHLWHFRVTENDLLAEILGKNELFIALDKITNKVLSSNGYELRA